jgi:hypothetical protein
MSSLLAATGSVGELELVIHAEQLMNLGLISSTNKTFFSNIQSSSMPHQTSYKTGGGVGTILWR